MKSLTQKWVMISFRLFALTMLASCTPAARAQPDPQLPVPSPTITEIGRLIRTFTPTASTKILEALQPSAFPTVSNTAPPTLTFSPIPSLKPPVSDQPTQTFAATASQAPTETVQPTPSFTLTASPTLTLTETPPPTPTPTRCPMPTQERLWVDPVTSPTDELSQSIVVSIGHGEEVTVVTESGTFTVQGNFVPFRVEIPLLPNTVHHLEVIAKVRKVTGSGGCIYGGYTMRTTRDRSGAPLTIVQGDPVPPTPSSPITVENVSRLQQLTSFAPNARLVTDFVFGDDHELISVGYDSNIFVWSADTGKEVRQLGNDQAGALVVAINSDGSWIATGGTVYDPAVRVWNPQSGEMNQLGTHPPYPTSLAFNLDGTRLASGSNNDSVIVWDVNNGQLLMTLKGDVSDRHQLFSSLYWKDGSTLIAAGSEAIYWWDTTTGSLLQRLAKPVEADFLVNAAFSQNGDRVAAAAQDACVYFWDQAVGQWSCWPTLAGSRVMHVSFSPDGQLLVAGTGDNRLLVWNVETGQLLAGYSTISGSLAAVRFSPGGFYIASGGWDGPIRLWGIP